MTDPLILKARKWQKMPITTNPYSNPVAKNGYCCTDSYKIRYIQPGDDNVIYITLTDAQHNAVKNEDWATLNSEKYRPSGFFTGCGSFMNYEEVQYGPF